MNARLSPSVRPGTAGAVAHVVVTSRLDLVAQAVCAGLGAGGLQARCMSWQQGHPAWDDPSPDQLLLVLDDLQSRAAVESVAGVVARWHGPSLLLTGRRAGATWGAVFSAGVSDIASSGCSLDEIRLVIRKVLSGQPHTDQRRRAAMEQQWAEWLTEEEDLEQRVDRLSPREASVLGRLAQGQRVRDIGVALGVSEDTVRSQVKSLRRKLGVESQLAAVALARRHSQRLPEGVPAVPVPRSRAE